MLRGNPSSQTPEECSWSPRVLDPIPSFARIHVLRRKVTHRADGTRYRFAAIAHRSDPVCREEMVCQNRLLTADAQRGV